MTQRPESSRGDVVAFIEERGAGHVASTEVMVQLVEHMYDFSGLNFSPWFDRLKGVRVGRPLANGRSQSFVTLYPGQPSLQFPHQGRRFKVAVYATLTEGSSVYRLVVPEDSDPQPYLEEAKALATEAHEAAVLGQGDAPSGSAVTLRQMESRRPLSFTVEPFTPRLEPITTAPTNPFVKDPVAVDRGNEAHRQVIEKLWTFLGKSGIQTISVRLGPNPDSELVPDLLWERDGCLFITEAKSLTTTNESPQLRLGLGQVLDYREHYRAMGRWDSVQAVLLVEAEPSSPRWERVCEANEVILVWPGQFARLL